MVESNLTNKPETPLRQALFPVLVLASLIIYGLIIRPQFFKEGTPDWEYRFLPLEIIFILASFLTVAQLIFLGHKWADIQASIVSKFQKALPAFFILFSIGLVIGSWIVCGTIPMLVYWGLKIIDPAYLYVLAFLAPVFFSLLTGTSWGSVGTIGIVLIGIAQAMDANLGITAGAIIGGAYFGDKLSPLSDTTNLAALAADVDLYDHIRSMLWTTVPSAIFAATIYLLMGWIYPPQIESMDSSQIVPFLEALSTMFNVPEAIDAKGVTIGLSLSIPPILVLIGSFRRLPTIPVLLTSVIVACVLAGVFQQFSLTDVARSVHKGFDTSMATWMETPDPSTSDLMSTLLNRGGLYSLSEAIFVAFTVFIFIGAMGHIRAMETVVAHLMRSVQSQPLSVLASLFTTAMTNAMTCNQYATSFIIGDAFKSKFDEQGIPRKVLSRSLEDTGTMLESIVPWHTSAVYMAATLGVPVSAYWCWQLLSLTNFVVAVILAMTGIGCYYQSQSRKPPTEKE